LDNNDGREAQTEIDLIDVWLILRRHLWLFLLSFLMIFILGIVAVTLRPEKYDYSVTVQLGGLRNATTGNLDPIILPDAESDALQNSIIPEVLQTYAVTHPGTDISDINIQVSTPKTGAQITLRVPGTLAQDSEMRSLLDAIVHGMIQAQGDVLQQHVAATKRLLGSQIVQLESQQAALEKNRQQLVANGNRADKAFTLLIFDNQITNLQQQILSIKQQLDVNLITDVQSTQSLTPPQRSVKPSGPGKMALVALAFVVALLLALFAVFLVHIRTVANQRIRSAS
jgi:uncharacterized protein involved in exopolysaccharide biosynthesis